MTWRAWLAFASLCVLWGIPYFFIKLAVAELPPAWVAWGRLALGAAILLPIAWSRGTLGQIRAHLGGVIAFAVIELAVPFVLIAVGERWISSSLTGILIASTPLMVIVLGPLFGIRERLGTRRLVGLALGFVGVVALLGIDPIGGTHQWLGVACVLISTAGYALGAVIVQRYLKHVDELSAVAASLGVASLLLLPAAALSLPPAWPSPLAITSIAVLGVVCTALALWLYMYLIAAAGAARATVITYINPAVAALLGVAVLHEPFGIGAAIGFVLILLGSWLATGRSRPS